MKTIAWLLTLAAAVAADVVDGLNDFEPFDNLPFDSKEDGRYYRHNISPRVPFAFRHADVACGAPRAWYPYEGDWAGWSRRPMCVDGVAADDASMTPTTFCIFSDQDFADGRGVVVLTTPATAQAIRSLAAFTDPESIKGQNDLVTGRYGPPPYVSHVFPTKGVGLISNTTLERGSRIMQETPSLIYNRRIYGMVAEEDRLPMHWHLVYQLPEHTREELLALHRHHGGDEIDDLMRTNAFGAYYSEEESHNNIFPRISRINHDCRPNSVYYFDSATMTQYIHAIRQIGNGEELSLTYTDVEAPYAARQAATKLSWGFGCQCSICRQPPDHVAASDHRLSRILTIKQQLNDWANPLPHRTELAEHMVDLYKLERLDGGIGSAYEAAAYAYAVAGDEWKVRRFATLAWDTFAIVYGAAHELTVDMAELMPDPKAHRTWKFEL